MIILKNNRNCGGAPYPVYPYPMMPMNQGPMNQGPMNQGMMNQMPSQMLMNQDTSSLSNQINNLEKRVNALENLVGNTGFNSNFQMM